MTEKELEDLFHLVEWPEDPYKEGKKRYEKAIENFRKIVNHSFFNFSNNINIIDLAAGTGIGGIALSKVLKEKGFNIKLYLTDLRENSLLIGKKFSESEEIPSEIIKSDIKNVHKLGLKADIALMYGNAHATFSPMDLNIIMAAVSETLNEDGLFIIQGINSFYYVFYERGYKEILPEKVDENKILVSIHSNYDHFNGMFKRYYLDLISGKKIGIDIRFWDFAEIIGISKIFFKEVDLIRDGILGFILAKNPRGLKVKDIE